VFIWMVVSVGLCIVDLT